MLKQHFLCNHFIFLIHFWFLYSMYLCRLQDTSHQETILNNAELSASSSLSSRIYWISLEIVILLWNSRKEIPLLPPVISKVFCSMAPKHCTIWEGGRSANCTTYAFEICSKRSLMSFLEIFLATQVHFSDSDCTEHIIFFFEILLH